MPAGVDFQPSQGVPLNTVEVSDDAGIRADAEGIIYANPSHAVEQRVAVDCHIRVPAEESDRTGARRAGTDVADDRAGVHGAEYDAFRHPGNEFIARDVYVRAGSNHEERAIHVAAELVAVDRRVAETEVCLDAVGSAGPGVVVILNQVELHQGRNRTGGVEFDARDVVLNYVVADLVTALGTGEAWVRPDPG